MKKYISILTTVALLLVPSLVFAFVPMEPNPSAPDGISPMVKTILGAIQWIGYAIAIGMLIYIGIKYVTSAANEKAELKSASVNYIIGAIIIAGAVTICNWAVMFFQSANSDGNAQGGAPTSGIGGALAGNHYMQQVH